MIFGNIVTGVPCEILESSVPRRNRVADDETCGALHTINVRDNNRGLERDRCGY